MPGRILVVDDEKIVGEVVERYLLSESYDVRVTEDGTKALEIAKEWQPDLVVLDLMLPGIDGLEVCRRLRLDRPVPIIMLELGADDYMVKPFSPRELVARVKSVLRRTIDSNAKEPDGILQYGDLVIDSISREVHVKGTRVNLTGKEFDLLYFLAAHPNQVFTREQLMNQVWDYSYGAEYGTITVHIRRLRSKLEADFSIPRFIKTLWGVGYKFEAKVHENRS